jgi:hypothetical protein
MEAVVFVGPTLSREGVLAELRAEVRPPARAGDVLRACASRPRFIGIIDGFFDRVPSVWHKEILFALEQGIRVVGAASMGALRAAELEAFGMEGVGAAFEAFRDGRLEDDDEVAVSHAAEADGYRTLSEALISIRATLDAAVAAGVLSSDSQQVLVRSAKSLFYPDRTYPALVRAGHDARLPDAELDRLEAWLPRGRIDVKREDALAALRHIHAALRSGGQRRSVGFTLANTVSWSALRTEVETEEAARGTDYAAPWAQKDVLLDELLVSGRCARVIEAALARALAARAGNNGTAASPDGRAVQASADDFRRERQLWRPEAFQAWLVAQRIPDGEVDAFFTREAVVRRARLMMEPDLLGHIRDQLRAMGVYGELASRAEAKQQGLTREGLSSPTVADTGLTEAQLWRWFFEQTLGRPLPDDIDGYAAREYSQRPHLLAAAIREYCFVTPASARPARGRANVGG